MNIILQHATGNANVRAAALGFNEAGILGRFQTTIAIFPGPGCDRIGSLAPFSRFRRRGFDVSLKHKTSSWPWKEIGRLASAKMGIKKMVEHEYGYFSIDAVIKNIDKYTADSLKKGLLKGVTGIYAYEDGALYSFLEAKRLGLKCLYDLPIGYWRAAQKLLEIEKEKWPEWQSTLTAFNDSADKLARKDKELELADHIYVASSFTAKTLEAFPGTLKDIKIIPYGYPQVNCNREFLAMTRRRLKLLFVGGLSQRKGIAELFSVMEVLKSHAELTIVGSKPGIVCRVLELALRKHRWIPTLPHDEILKLMREYDVLVFPSLFEGFGLVITEAMSQGMPVITTERTAGPDLIEHGHNGWLIKAGSSEELQATLENLLFDPRLIKKAGTAAIDTAAKRPWDVYGKELAEAVIHATAI